MIWTVSTVPGKTGHAEMGVITAVICFGMGLLALGLALTAAQIRNRIERDWIALEAIIVESRIRWWGPFAHPVVMYEYHSGDLYYAGYYQPMTFFPFSARRASTVARRYREGDTVSVYVNPDDHRRSILEPTPRWLSIGAFSCATICFCFGAIALSS